MKLFSSSFSPVFQLSASDGSSVQCCRPPPSAPHLHLMLLRFQKLSRCLPVFSLPPPTAAPKHLNFHPAFRCHRQHRQVHPPSTPALRLSMKSHQKLLSQHRPPPSSPRLVTNPRPRHWPLHRSPTKPPRSVTRYRRKHWPPTNPVDGGRTGGSRGYGESTRALPG